MKMIFICFRITASNYYGARHGIETLFQMILWDDKTHEYKMLNNVNITDGPEFSHRGISLDTVRNYISLDKMAHTMNPQHCSVHTHNKEMHVMFHSVRRRPWQLGFLTRDGYIYM